MSASGAPRHGIYVDLQAAQSLANAERGIARYSIELTAAMLRVGAPIEAIGLSPVLPNPTRLPESIATSELLTWYTTTGFDAVRSRADRPLAYHVMSPMETQTPARLTLPLSAMRDADALVMVWYDLIPLVFADRYLPQGRERAPYLARLELVKQADLLLAISEHSRRDLIEYLGIHPDRVVAIGGGVSDWFAPPAADADPFAGVRAAVAAVDRPYVLTVAGWEWRKNTEALIQAFAALPRAVRKDLQLVIACSVGASGEAEWRGVAAAAGLSPEQLVITGFVDDETLRALYQACRLFVFPSRYEGYGLPVIEAARCGAPVVTSSTSSLPEILDLPESTFAPDDVAEMSDVIGRGVSDDAYRSRLSAAGARAVEVHTWDNVARRTVAAYERLDARMPPRRRSPRRTRVAFVSPFFPAESGVAVYNSRVLDALDAPDLEIDLFAEETHIGAWKPRFDRPVFPIEHLGARINPYDYDTIVYTIGNSTFHLATYAMAREVPGIVWLHDVNLVGLHFERSKRIAADDMLNLPNLVHPPRSAADAMRAELRTAYGDRANAHLFRNEPLGHQAYLDRGARMAAGVVRGARHLICNSSVAERMVRIDLGPSAAMPPTTVLPLAPSDPSAFGLDRARRGASGPERPLVVSLGIVDGKKRPVDIVRALAGLDPACDLAFVGPCGDALRAEIEEAARVAAFGGSITFTGFVDFEDYGRWLGAAALAVQLRSVNFGESSGAVADAIAAAVPTITSVASCADLPPDVVRMVAPDASVTEIRATIRELLVDQDRADAMRAACVAYGASWTFGHVATAVADVVRGVSGRR